VVCSEREEFQMSFARRYMFAVVSLVVIAMMLVGIVGLTSSQPAAAQRTREDRGASTVSADSSSLSSMLMNRQQPKLVVVISFDQLREDYMTRFADLFLPATQSDGTVGGFRYFMQNGAFFTNNEYRAFPQYTGTGHSTQLTGADPYKSGIIGNDWFSRQLNDFFYVVEDQRFTQVGAPSSNKHTGTAPTSLKATTVGDELKASNARQSKTVAVALKDRAAILMGGHSTDGTYWFDVASGNMVSSTYWFSSTLPAWVTAFNTSKPLDKYYNTTWDRLLPADQYARQGADDTAYETAGTLGKTFPHKLTSASGKPDRGFYNDVTTSPFGNDYLLGFAKQAVISEKLGQNANGVADLLTISFSSNDYLGHAYGPQSQEVEDITVRSDRQVADLLNFLNTNVPGGLDNVVIAITADHGVAPVSSYALNVMKLDAGFQSSAQMAKIVQDTFSQTYGAGNYLAGDGYIEPYLYLDYSTLASKNVKVEDARKFAAQTLNRLPGVANSYTSDQIINGDMPLNDTTQRLMYAFNREVSGDVVVVNKQNWYPWSGPTGTTHGSAYAYDTHVPMMLAGKMIKSGFYNGKINVNDLAPTLSTILGIQVPSGSDGHTLDMILK